MSTRGQRNLRKGQNYGRSKQELEKGVKKLEPTIFLRYTQDVTHIITCTSVNNITGSCYRPSSSADLAWN